MTGRFHLSDSRDLSLLRELTISQFKLKDQSTFFGLLWSLLNPLVMVGILFVFFATRFGEGVENYRIFLLLGMVQYTYFATATSTSMRSLVTMRQLTGGALFPKELLVISSTLASTVDFAIAMAACVALAYVTGTPPHWAHLLILLVVLAEILLVTWVSMLLACGFAMARDLQHLYQVFLRALMFITPIFYSASSVGEGIARYVLMLNPLAQLLAVSRSILLDSQIPDARTLVIIALTNMVMLVLSWYGFKLLEPRIVEYV